MSIDSRRGGRPVPRVLIALSLGLAAAGVLAAASCGSFQGQTYPAVEGGTAVVDAGADGDSTVSDASIVLDAGPVPGDGSLPEAAPPLPMPGTTLCDAGITTTSICDNFDGMGIGGGIADFWSGMNLAQSVVDQGTFVTPPGSLRAYAPYRVDDSLYVGVQAEISLTDGTNIAIDFDYAVEIDVGYTELVQVRVNDLDTFRFLVAPNETTALFATVLPDAGVGESLRASSAKDSRGAWHHAHLELSFVSSTAGTASMTIDHGSTIVTTRTGVTYPTNNAPSKVTVRIGDGPGAASGPTLVNLDNFYARTL